MSSSIRYPEQTPLTIEDEVEVTKALSGAFGDRRKRRAQLVARLKRRRKYGPPVKGGTKTRSPERRSSRF